MIGVGVVMGSTLIECFTVLQKGKVDKFSEAAAECNFGSQDALVEMNAQLVLHNRLVTSIRGKALAVRGGYKR